MKYKKSHSVLLTFTVEWKQDTLWICLPLSQSQTWFQSLRTKNSSWNILYNYNKKNWGIKWRSQLDMILFPTTISYEKVFPWATQMMEENICRTYFLTVREDKTPGVQICKIFSWEFYCSTWRLLIITNRICAE